MKSKQKMPNTNQVMQGLKDFQRKTVRYVYKRLYTDNDCVDRFLIADEVGLGKTLVARGLIAKAIEHLWEKVPRIDIVYICANGDIARQNVNRLNVTGEKEMAIATRMTLLPLKVHNLKGNKINFVSFTPGTSFDLHSRGGIAKERILIYHILRKGWEFGDSAGLKNFFQCDMSKNNWRRFIEQFDESEIDKSLTREYLKALRENRIKVRFNRIVKRFSHYRKHIPQDDKEERRQLIGDLRTILARSCVEALEPDLVILDEFQRFKNLLDGDDEVARLAKAVFDYQDVKVLLLSATPYKMYTMYHESDDEDHYIDFLRTVKFLFSTDKELKSFQIALDNYRRSVLSLSKIEFQDLQNAKSTIERKLRKIMVRTERISATYDHSAMVAEAKIEADPLRCEDLRAFAMFDGIADLLDVGNIMEYWKSAPYLLNMMDRDSYKIKRLLVSKIEKERSTELINILVNTKNGLLPWHLISKYKEIDPENAKLRTLIDHKVNSGSWKLLWVPPSLPYYRPNEGPFVDPKVNDFTKSLVFSSWHVVPKVIAGLPVMKPKDRWLFPWIVKQITQQKGNVDDPYYGLHKQKGA